MPTPVTEIDLGDPRAVSDLATFVGRAKQANPEGAVRLQLMGPLLVTTVAVIEGSGLLGEGTVLGLRAVRVASEGVLDTTVALAAVSDRLARADGSDAGADGAAGRGAGAVGRAGGASRAAGSRWAASRARTSTRLRDKASRRSPRAPRTVRGARPWRRSGDACGRR